MIARVAVASLALIAGRAELAHACGADGSGDSGGSSGSSGGGSSGGGSGGDSSSSSSTAVPACYEVSDIVGYRQCTSYGAGWAIPEHLPALALELSTWTARVDLADVDVSGSIHHSTGPDYTYRVVGRDLGSTALANGLKLRMVGHRGRVYAGLEGAAAHLGSDQRTQMMADGMTELTSNADTLMMGGLVIGVDHPVGRMTVGLEAFAGGRGVVVEATSHRGACETEDQRVVGHAVVEGRVRADVWLTPWLTAGGYAGKDAVTGQTSAGLSLAGHLRAFDGGR